MKKVGFVDYFLDEWHANNYPEMIKNATAGEMIVTRLWHDRWRPERGIIRPGVVKWV